MNFLLITIVYVFSVQYLCSTAIPSKMYCDFIEAGNCNCESRGNLRFSCPKRNPKVTVRDEPYGSFDSGIIHLNMSSSDNIYELLPNLTIGTSYAVEFVNYFPSNGITSERILQKLGIKDVNILHLIDTDVNGFSAGFSSLEHATIKNCKIRTLPMDIFRDAENIRDLTITQNGLETLPHGIFDRQTRLRVLNLSKNSLQTLPVGIFDKMMNLISLHLSFNKLQYITESSFGRLTQLKELHLDHNELHKIHQNAFGNVKELTVLDLSHNQLNFEKNVAENSSLLGGMEKLLEVLAPTSYLPGFLYMNMMTKFGFSGHEMQARFDPWNSSVIINLSHNRIQRITTTDLIHLKRAHETNNHKSNIKRWIIILDENPFHCDCEVSEFIEFSRKIPTSRHYLENFELMISNFKCKTPKQFERRPIKYIPPKSLQCRLDSTVNATEKFCPPNCECMIRMVDRVVEFNCSNAQITEVPHLPSVKEVARSLQNLAKIPDAEISLIIEALKYELHVENNQITTLPVSDEGGYSSVSKIFAQNNSIASLTKENLPENLSFLDLSDNRLEKLNSDVLKQFMESKTFEKLMLKNNPLICDCDNNNNLMKLFQLHTKVDYENIRCHDDQLLLDKSFDCSTYKIGILIPIFLLLVATFIAFYYKYQQEISVWLFAHNWCLWLITEDELDKDKKFDAFISFSHKDARFVTEVLLSELEKEPNPFKICVHFRDWTVGHFIPDQIAKSVEDSRRTVIVLSPNFLESIWGLMELRVAHQNALAEKRTRVIVILRGDIGNIDDLDPELRAYLRTNTYLEWDDPRFFDKLRYALPHPSNSKTLKTTKKRNKLLKASRNSGRAIDSSAVIPIDDFVSDSTL